MTCTTCDDKGGYFSQHGWHDCEKCKPPRTYRESILASISSQNEPAKWGSLTGFWCQGGCVFIPARSPEQAIQEYRSSLASAQIGISHNLNCGSIRGGFDGDAPARRQPDGSGMRDQIIALLDGPMAGEASDDVADALLELLMGSPLVTGIREAIRMLERGGPRDVVVQDHLRRLLEDQG